MYTPELAKQLQWSTSCTQFFSLPYRIWLTVFLFVCRALIAGAFQALYVYTPEVYPTRVRALGLGISSTVGRIGGIISPYIAQVHVLTVVNCDNSTWTLQSYSSSSCCPSSGPVSSQWYCWYHSVHGDTICLSDCCVYPPYRDKREETQSESCIRRLCWVVPSCHPMHAHTWPLTPPPTCFLLYSGGSSTVIVLLLHLADTAMCHAWSTEAGLELIGQDVPHEGNCQLTNICCQLMKAHVVWQSVSSCRSLNKSFRTFGYPVWNIVAFLYRHGPC